MSKDFAGSILSGLLVRPVLPVAIGLELAALQQAPDPPQP
ncbi:hypothetical protein SpAn4DRAFT_1630 [Sporomusa ovata]|uniref:Uncharacterized protein n=1 Tax=Sporomusa ovata TaxID=2378 RepID=A0A0U1KTA2_9FIRM|nr:hypothetical protein SpAn4DRAFT_1630 [Sporomusa ovata]